MAKRRRNSEGSLFQRKDGLWVARVSHEGRRVTVYGKAEAAQKLRKLLSRQDQGLPLVTSTMLVRDYLDQWLVNTKNRVRPKTFIDDESLVRVHLLPALGHIRLGKVMPEHIDKAYREMETSGKSASVMGHAHHCLSKALNDAMKRQLIYRNPCQAVTPPRANKRELHPPDVEAINRLLEVARPTEYFEALHLAFFTGARRGELLGLRWRDVDLDMASISINRSLYRARGGESVFTEPKTVKGCRLVSLTPSSVLVLRSLRERQEADGLLQGYRVSGDSPVFRYRDGSPILPSGLSHAFKRLCVTAGLPGYRLHDTRHAHATLMLRQGVHPKIVQERLGHATISVTLDTYSHVSPGLQEAAALRFEEGLTAATREPVLEPLAG